MASMRVFQSDTGDVEEWLDVNEDGSTTYYVRNPESRFPGHGEKITWADAKARWPSYVEKIDAAIAALKK